MKEKKEFIYTGQSNLEAMTEAVNYNKFLISLVIDQMNNKEDRILDFGAGSGTYSCLLKKMNITSDCLEPDSTLRNILDSLGFKVFEDLEEIKPESYDLIFSLNVFEHIEDDLSQIKVLKSKLKEGGRLLIYVPAYQVLFSNMDKKVGHYRRYRIRDLRKLAESSGFKIRMVRYYDPAGFAAALFYRISGGNGNLSAKSISMYDKIIFPFSKKLHSITNKFIGKNAILVVEK